MHGHLNVKFVCTQVSPTLQTCIHFSIILLYYQKMTFYSPVVTILPPLLTVKTQYLYLYHAFYVCVPFDSYNIQLLIPNTATDAGLLARSQYPEGPTTGHLDTGFSWFPCA